MIFDKETRKVKFIRRPNRFQGYVEIDGEEVLTHVPNTGKLGEILVQGVDVLIRVEDNPNRKTAYSLIGAWKNNKLINIDSQIPNKLVEEALIKGKIEKLKDYKVIQREKTFGKSRFDFKLLKDINSEKSEDIYYLEVKGVTLEFDGVVAFPDAVTERGSKHLLELVEAKKQGYGSGVIFIVQLKDVKYFRPYGEKDPNFEKNLIYAKKNGVDIFCYDCIVNTDSIEINELVETRIGGK